MVAWVCEECGRVSASNRAFSCHRRQCKVRRGEVPRTIARDDGAYDVEDFIRYIQDTTQNQYSYPETTPERYSPGPPPLDEDEIWVPEAETAEDDRRSIHTGTSICMNGPGLLSTSDRTLKRRTFEDVTGKRAGEGVHQESDTESAGCPTDDANSQGRNCESNEWYPFRSAADYAMAEWLSQNQVSKGAIDDFCANPDLEPLWQHTSFSNGDQFKQLLEYIQSGIMDDGWEKSQFTRLSEVEGISDITYTIYHRDVIKCIQFLIGHRPFAHNMVYAPVRNYNSEDPDDPEIAENDSRIYSEMHTADWWWKMQEQLCENATVIPLIISSDKTMLSQLSGDQALWPVYLTIGNLDTETRRQRIRPSTVLLGLLPIPEEPGPAAKSGNYHLAMEAILKPLESLYETGIHMTCADGLTRHCFPIIAAFTVDYEEQAVMTGIKSLKHCAVCRVPPDERETLCPDRAWEPRTHQWTQRQIRKQQAPDGRRRYPDGHPDRVHPLRNFAWAHRYLNIHSTLTPDNLHMLDKGMVKHLDKWTRARLGATVRAKKGKRPGHRTLPQTNSTKRLDQRFRAVPAYSNLKHFPHYSLVTQWTGAEYKSLTRQLVPVVAPLLIKESPDALQCIRAFMDFVMLARYASHTEETLSYMDHALFRFGKMKEVFREYRKTGNFNFPKYHALYHYIPSIREVGSLLGFDTAISEAEHIDQVKNFYNRTNKRGRWHEQILLHNTRSLKMKVMADLRLHATGHTLRRADFDMRTQVNRVARPKDHGPRGLNWLKSPEEEREITRTGRKSNCWCYASTVAREAQLPDLLDALAVFVREMRKKATMEEPTPTRREPDPSWVASYIVTLHPSIVTWKKTGKDPADLDRLTEETIYCSPDWQRQGQGWRRDFVWVQEHTAGSTTRNNKDYPQGGRLVGQLLVTLTVIDHQRQDERGWPCRYTGCFIATQRFRNNGACHNVHGMVEIEPWPRIASHHPRTLVGRRFYELTNVIRSAHIVPDDTNTRNISYINNYIDFDQFNTLYDPEFLTNGTRAALAIEKLYAQHSRGT